MRSTRAVVVTVMLAAAGVGGCVDSDSDEPETGEAAAALSQVFYEKFDNLQSSYIDGQSGWTSTGCVVFDGVLPNKYLRCVDGAAAWKATQEPGGAGSYTLQFDYRPNVNVTASTHGKLSIEGPNGRVFQIVGGCDGLRMAFQMNGPVAVLKSFTCGSTSRETWYRIGCRWTTGGTTLTCGASVLPADPGPADDVTLALPSGLRPFSSVMVSTFAGQPGASLWDKIQVLRQ